jgi:hypothetical protein
LVGYQNGYLVFTNGLVAGYESEFNYADVRVSMGHFQASTRRLQWFGMERLRWRAGRFLPCSLAAWPAGKVRPWPALQSVFLAVRVAGRFRH